MILNFIFICNLARHHFYTWSHLHVCTRTLRMDDIRNEAVLVAGALFDPRKWPKPSAYPKCPVPAGHEDAVSLEKTAICALRSRSLKRFPPPQRGCPHSQIPTPSRPTFADNPISPVTPPRFAGTRGQERRKGSPARAKGGTFPPSRNEPPPTTIPHLDSQSGLERCTNSVLK